MEITNEGLEWNTEDIDLWRQFLRTRAGERLIPKLLESVPQLLPGGETNDILTRAGEVRGWQQAAKALLDLTAYPPLPNKQDPSNYPSLDDPENWKDEAPVNPLNPK